MADKQKKKGKGSLVQYKGEWITRAEREARIRASYRSEKDIQQMAKDARIASFAGNADAVAKQQEAARNAKAAEKKGLFAKKDAEAVKVEEPVAEPEPAVEETEPEEIAEEPEQEPEALAEEPAAAEEPEEEEAVAEPVAEEPAAEPEPAAEEPEPEEIAEEPEQEPETLAEEPAAAEEPVRETVAEDSAPIAEPEKEPLENVRIRRINPAYVKRMALTSGKNCDKFVLDFEDRLEKITALSDEIKACKVSSKASDDQKAAANAKRSELRAAHKEELRQYGLSYNKAVALERACDDYCEIYEALTGEELNPRKTFRINDRRPMTEEEKQAFIDSLLVTKAAVRKDIPAEQTEPAAEEPAPQPEPEPVAEEPAPVQEPVSQLRIGRINPAYVKRMAVTSGKNCDKFVIDCADRNTRIAGLNEEIKANRTPSKATDEQKAQFSAKRAELKKEQKAEQRQLGISTDKAESLERACDDYCEIYFILTGEILNPRKTDRINPKRPMTEEEKQAFIDSLLVTKAAVRTDVPAEQPVAEPQPEPVAEEPAPEPVAEEPVPEPVVEEPAPEPEPAEEPASEPVSNVEVVKVRRLNPANVKRMALTAGANCDKFVNDFGAREQKVAELDAQIKANRTPSKATDEQKAELSAKRAELKKEQKAEQKSYGVSYNKAVALERACDEYCAIYEFLTGTALNPRKTPRINDKRELSIEEMEDVAKELFVKTGIKIAADAKIDFTPEIEEPAPEPVAEEPAPEPVAEEPAPEPEPAEEPASEPVSNVEVVKVRRLNPANVKRMALTAGANCDKFVKDFGAREQRVEELESEIKANRTPSKATEEEKTQLSIKRAALRKEQKAEQRSYGISYDKAVALERACDEYCAIYEFLTGTALNPRKTPRINDKRELSIEEMEDVAKELFVKTGIKIAADAKIDFTPEIEEPAPEPAPQPVIVVVPEPVAEEPVPEPEPEVVAEEPAPEPEPEVVAEEPAQEPEPEVVAEEPAPEPEPEVVAEEPVPEPEPEVVAEEPVPEPEPEPVVPVAPSDEKPKKKRPFWRLLILIILVLLIILGVKMCKEDEEVVPAAPPVAVTPVAVEQTPADETPEVEEPVVEEPVVVETPQIPLEAEPVKAEEPVEAPIAIETPILVEEEPVEEPEIPVVEEEPVVEEVPVIEEEPLVEEEPVIEEPVIEEPVIEEPAVEEPVVEEPAAEPEVPEVIPTEVTIDVPPVTAPFTGQTAEETLSTLSDVVYTLGDGREVRGLLGNEFAGVNFPEGINAADYVDYLKDRYPELAALPNNVEATENSIVADYDKTDIHLVKELYRYFCEELETYLQNLPEPVEEVPEATVEEEEGPLTLIDAKNTISLNVKPFILKSGSSYTGAAQIEYARKLGKRFTIGVGAGVEYSTGAAGTTISVPASAKVGVKLNEGGIALDAYAGTGAKIDPTSGSIALVPAIVGISGGIAVTPSTELVVGTELQVSMEDVTTQPYVSIRHSF